MPPPFPNIMDRRKFLQTANAIGMSAVVPASSHSLLKAPDCSKAARQIVLGTETTGLAAAWGDRIVEIGCVELLGRKLTGNNRHFYLNPGRDSSEDALAVHGLTTEFLRDKPRFEAVADCLIEYLQGAEILIHNAPFDVGFLNDELELAGRPLLEQIVGSVTDTLVMAKEMYPGERNSVNVLCDQLGVDRSTRTLHGAALHAALLADVYIELTRDWGPPLKDGQWTPPAQMRPELQAELLRRYPKFFRKPGRRLVDAAMSSDGKERLQDDTGPFDQRGVECGDGWFALIDRLCRAHENEIETMASWGMVKEHWPRVAQIKEKFGSLYICIRGQVSEELDEERFRVLQYVSRRTCEQCGAPKKPWQYGSWITLCNGCAAVSAGSERRSNEAYSLEHTRVLAMLDSRPE